MAFPPRQTNRPTGRAVRPKVEHRSITTKKAEFIRKEYVVREHTYSNKSFLSVEMEKKVIYNGVYKAAAQKASLSSSLPPCHA